MLCSLVLMSRQTLFFSILESKANLVVTDRTKKNIVMTDFIQFKSHDVATKKHNVATQFVLLLLKVAT